MFSNVFFLKKFFCCLSHLFTLFLSLISFYVKRCLLGASMFVRALMLGAPLHTTYFYTQPFVPNFPLFFFPFIHISDLNIKSIFVVVKRVYLDEQNLFLKIFFFFILCCLKCFYSNFLFKFRRNTVFLLIVRPVGLFFNLPLEGRFIRRGQSNRESRTIRRNTVVISPRIYI
ncbi:unnamed protein product [Meloidogyne enterolobii]|uniref:Uncharacterized protein n=1 Tax=Meloidogyne enterolobii TaxID=390850 RepID=A0ACB0YW34_MELEN